MPTLKVLDFYVLSHTSPYLEGILNNDINIYSSMLQCLRLVKYIFNIRFQDAPGLHVYTGHPMHLECELSLLNIIILNWSTLS